MNKKKKIFIITPIFLFLILLIIFSKDYKTIYSKKPVITNIKYKEFLVKNRDFNNSCLGEIETIKYYNSLYNDVIDIVLDLERNSFINNKFKNELFSLLKNGKIYELLVKLDNITLTKLNNTSLSNRFLLQALINDMTFNDNNAEKFYKISIENNKFNYKAYFHLAKLYKKNCKYKESINVLLSLSSILNNNNLRGELNVLYSELGDLYFDLRDYYNSLSNYANALINLDIKNIDEEKYHVLIKMGDIMLIRGNIVEAIDYYKYALSLNNRKISREENISLLLKLSSAYYSYGNYYNGLKFAKTASKKAKILKNNLLCSKTYYLMCLNYEYLNENEKAKTACNIAKKLVENNNNFESYTHLADMLSFVSYIRDEDLAIEYYTKAMNMIDKNILLKTSLLEKISAIKSYRMKPDALKSLIDLDEIYDFYGINRGCCNNVIKGLIEERIGKKKDAEKIYIQAEKDNQYNYSSLATLYGYMSDYYKNNNNSELAVFYAEQALYIAKNIYKYDHHYIKYYYNKLSSLKN